MKRQVRRGVFETNSSSVHSICITTQSEYDKWKNGEVFYCIYDGCFCTKEDLLQDYPEYDDEDLECRKTRRNEFDCYTFDEWHDWSYIEYETYSKKYTSQSGDKLVAFGYYGHD